MTNYAKTKTHNDANNEINEKGAPKIIYIPEIHLLGTGYMPGQIVSGNKYWNFSEQEAVEWLEEHTVNFAKLEKINKVKFAYTPRVVGLEIWEI